MSALPFDGLSVGFACLKDETSATCNNGEQRTQIKPASIAPLILPAFKTINVDALSQAPSALGDALASVVEASQHLLTAK